MTIYDLEKFDSLNILKGDGVDLKSLYQDSDCEQSILENLKLNIRRWRYNDKIYKIIRYNKDYLTFDRVSTSGLFRSVICRNNKIIVFSPPKAIDIEKFCNSYLPSDCVAEEFIEGTMINLFYDEEWEIATRSSVGGKISFFYSKEASETFRKMFLDACNANNLEFDKLDKNICYSFVLQHPNNRIVTPFSEMKLYIVACYSINNYSVEVKPIISQKERLSGTTVLFPEKYSFTDFSELQDKWASSNTDYKYVGVMLYHVASGTRSKMRNPNYEMVRQLRGNQPKSQYRYLVLRNQGKVGDYLKYYPEDSKSFNIYRNQIHDFTKQLHNNYIKCYVNKVKPLLEYPYQYRSHMFELHQYYINNLRPNKQAVMHSVVIEYINKMPPAKLMFSINYHLRKKLLEEDKIDSKLL